MASAVDTYAALSNLERPERDQRVARGKAARARVPRSRQSELSPGPRGDAIALLEQQAKTRVPELIPVRYGRMLQSPFAFYRGAAIVMASDLAKTPASGLRSQLCGDAHLANFGMFATPERNLVFDTNDFDETLPGPWEWDVKRLAASIEVAGRDNQFSAEERRLCVNNAVTTYQAAMNSFAEKRNLELWYTRMDVERAMDEYTRELSTKALKRSRQQITKAEGRDSESAFAKLTRVVEGEPHIAAAPPLIVPIGDLFAKSRRQAMERGLRELFVDYHRSLPSERRVLIDQYRIVDVARKVVGVGSVGTRCWIILLVGIDNGDPLFLQIKEAQPSVLERFTERCKLENQGERVVAGQRAMQAASDILLGWGRAAGIDGVKRDYYVRQLHDKKGSFESAEMLPAGMAVYAKICGWTLARAHARTGDRVAIASYLGKNDVFAEAIGAFARAYADVNEADHDALVRAVRAGKIKAEKGV